MTVYYKITFVRKKDLLFTIQVSDYTSILTRIRSLLSGYFMYILIYVCVYKDIDKEIDLRKSLELDHDY